MKCTSFTVLQSEIEKCCQEDNCLWIIEDSDLMDLPFDKTWPLSPFKYKVSYLEMVQFQTYINFEIFLGEDIFLSSYEVKCR